MAKLIQTGLTVEVVAGAVGISEPTFYAWMVRGEGARAADAPYRAFREAVEAARAEHEAILGRLTTPKSGRVRAVPMAPDVAAAIAQLGRRDGWTGDDDLVFAEDGSFASFHLAGKGIVVRRSGRTSSGSRAEDGAPQSPQPRL